MPTVDRPETLAKDAARGSREASVPKELASVSPEASVAPIERPATPTREVARGNASPVLVPSPNMRPSSAGGISQSPMRYSNPNPDSPFVKYEALSKIDPAIARQMCREEKRESMANEINAITFEKSFKNNFYRNLFESEVSIYNNIFM